MKMNRPAFKIDTENPGSEIAGEAAAALAAASILFRADDPTYSQNLLAHAQALFDFADSHRGSYIDVITSARDYYNSSGYHDELVWSALWLYKATGKGDYLQKAESIYRKHFAKASMRWTHSWDDKRYGATIILAQPTKCEPYRAAVRRWLNYWTMEIKESESNTRPVAWRGWTHGAHCAMQARPLFSPSSTPIRLKTLGVAIAISPVSRSIIFWERTPEGAATWSDLATIRHAIPTIELPMVHHPLKARVPKSLQIQEEQSRHQQGQQDRKPQRLPRKARRRSRPQCRVPPFAKL